ncbi:MAG TPA: TlpA disulfide reductase family protein [Candidatus Methylomirabilis sp.]|nr:TlpA disulfide reductase family protein [Candidatus Methylomirabilis sp.]
MAASEGALYTARVKRQGLIAALALTILLLPLRAGAQAAQDPVAALGLTRPQPIELAKPFRVQTPGQRSLSLADFKGRVVLLNFWATWCKPCEAEMPSMERLHRHFESQGLTVLAIAEDHGGAAVVAPYLEKHRLSFRVGLDPTSSVASLYGVWGVPSTFIIDRRGTRALYANGPREWDGPAARALFQSLLR